MTGTYIARLFFTLIVLCCAASFIASLNTPASTIVLAAILNRRQRRSWLLGDDLMVRASRSPQIVAGPMTCLPFPRMAGMRDS